MDNGVNSVFMGVGGSFDVLSGHIKRAPMWMQKANLEWLFRVANEPKRLFKRYFVGNATFIKRVVHEKRKAKKYILHISRNHGYRWGGTYCLSVGDRPQGRI